MHAYRSVPTPAGVARRGTPEHEHQRRLLLELAVSPPPDGDAVVDLARVLELDRAEIEAAAAGLERAGLARRSGTRLFATPAVMAVEALWPFAL